MAKLRPFNPNPEMGTAGGGASCEHYRLDDLWLLQCCYNDSDNTLFHCKLVDHMRWIWVAPPPHFTGVWVTYFPNGQRSHEINYIDGKQFGDFTSFRSDGSKCVLTHFGPDGAEGEETGFFPSGHIAYRGNYKANEQVGTWTWYNEDGLTVSTKEQGKTPQ